MRDLMGQVLVATWCCLLAANALAVEPAGKPYDATELYEPREIDGWKILVHPLLLQEHVALGEQTLELLAHQLYQIRRRLPEAAVAKLRTVPIWVEYNHPKHPCMCYHPGRDWLLDNGMNPEKAKGVEIANASNFLKWTTDQPWMVLHELAHAYHDQFVDQGFANTEVATLQARLKDRESYMQTLHINGQRVKHYALNNPQEYFAESTEAFFGTNDYFPYVRSELASDDPEMFALLAKLWGAK